MESEGSIQLRKSGPIAVITIDRPGVRNALDIASAHALMAAVDEIDADPQILVAILTGTGKAFSAGADLRARARGEPRAVIEPFGFGGFIRKPRTKPFIAAVNGFAVGGGLELALACDLVVASSEATFALPEVGRGLIAGGDCLPFLCRRLPRALAVEMAITGRKMSAAEAMSFGLVNAVGPDALNLAMEFANRISENTPLAVSATMALLRTLEGGPPSNYYELANSTQERLMRSADAAEASLAAAEKRPPRWSGR